MEVARLGQRELRQLIDDPGFAKSSSPGSPAVCVKKTRRASGELLRRNSPGEERRSRASTEVLPKPHQLVLAIGALAALGTFASGIAPVITEWTRPLDGHARALRQHSRAGLEVAFYATVSVMLFVAAWLVEPRVRNYERGRPDDRRTTSANVAPPHARLPRPASGCARCCATPRPGSCTRASTSASWCCSSRRCPRGRPPAARVAQVPARPDATRRTRFGGRPRSAWCSSSASSWAILRRYVQRPYRIRIKTKPEDAFILGTFLAIGVTGFFTEALRIAAIGRPDFEKWSLRRLAALGPLRHARRQHGSRRRTAGCGAPTSWHSSPSS